MLGLMVLPLITCLILIAILVYLGIHIVEREVIFVDLALAQIAALGTLIAFIFGLEMHGTSAFLTSLAFTIAGAVIFTLTRAREKSISQEAIIGIVYAFSMAGSILVLNWAPAEAEHIKHMLVGNILFVKMSEVVVVGIIAGVIGLFHYIYRRRFLLISTNAEEAERKGISLRWWDFLFYASFGLVITSSVAIAGVLLVFSYLIAPAVCAMLLSGSIKTRLALGWSVGILASLIGLYLSASIDFPTGAAIVCSLSLFVPVVAIIRKMIRPKKVVAPYPVRGGRK